MNRAEPYRTGITTCNFQDPEGLEIQKGTPVKYYYMLASPKIERLQKSDKPGDANILSGIPERFIKKQLTIGEDIFMGDIRRELIRLRKETIELYEKDTKHAQSDPPGLYGKVFEMYKSGAILEKAKEHLSYREWIGATVGLLIEGDCLSSDTRYLAPDVPDEIMRDLHFLY